MNDNAPPLSVLLATLCRHCMDESELRARIAAFQQEHAEAIERLSQPEREQLSAIAETRLKGLRGKA